MAILSKYVTRGYVADECAFEQPRPLTTLSVSVCEDAEPIGLVDASGVPLYRKSERVAAGFVSYTDPCPECGRSADQGGRYRCKNSGCPRS